MVRKSSIINMYLSNVKSDNFREKVGVQITENNMKYDLTVV